MVNRTKIPVPIQLAIQGGGAKIAALMATLEAVDSLQSAGRLKVTRIAGTSAGAIVGAVYAAGTGMMAVGRRRVSLIKPREVYRMFPSPWPPRRPHLLLKLGFGYPIWKTVVIENLLLEVLREAKTNCELISDLEKVSERNIILKIVAADLTNAGKILYEKQDGLISSIMDSCGLPFCFRTWSRSGSPVIVDGGICENLPSSELDSPEDVKKYGPVVGISFERPAHQAVDNPVKFAAALLDTAMQNSMERARQRLGEGSVFTIQTNLSTFNFAGALKDGFDPKGAYGFVRNAAHEWFSDYLDRYSDNTKQVLMGDPWSTQNLDSLEKMGDVYRAQHASRKAKYSFCSLLVQAKCLLSPDEPDYGSPDFVHYTAQFRTLDDTIFCQRVLISDTPHTSSVAKSTWTVADLTSGKLIRTVDLPMRSPGSKPGRGRELLLFLDPPLPANSAGEYLFDFQDYVKDFMSPLRDGKDDLVFIPSQAEATVDKIDLILWVPENAPNVRLTGKPGVVGRLMNAGELANYAAPPGYRAYGFTGSNALGNREFGVDVASV